MKTQIKNIKVGEFFTLKDYGEQDVPECAVWVRGEYDKSSKTYSCCKFNDACHEHFFKGTKEVFAEFYF